MSKEEVPFKSVKVTLSEEAIRMLGTLRYRGAFRSDSMTVEECIRRMYDICEDIGELLQLGEDRGEKLTSEEQAVALQRIGIRVKRFVPPIKKKQQKQ